MAQEISKKEDSIYKKAHKIDSLYSNYPTVNIRIDNSTLLVKKSDSKIETQSVFQNSESKLFISYYFENGQLILVQIKESFDNVSDTAKITDFFIDDNQLIFNHVIYKVSRCVPETEEYNKRFNEHFLRRFSKSVLKKIKKIS